MTPKQIEHYQSQIKDAQRIVERLEIFKQVLANLDSRIVESEKKSEKLMHRILISDYYDNKRKEIRVPYLLYIPYVEQRITELQAELDNFALTII